MLLRSIGILASKYLGLGDTPKDAGSNLASFLLSFAALLAAAVKFGIIPEQYDAWAGFIAAVGGVIIGDYTGKTSDLRSSQDDRF